MQYRPRSATPEQAARISRLLDKVIEEARNQGYEDGWAAASKETGKRRPITKAQAVKIYESSLLIGSSVSFAAFERILRVVEGVHKITDHP